MPAALGLRSVRNQARRNNVLLLPGAIKSNNPLGYWRLDEASGTLADSSGNNRTGTTAGTGQIYQGAPGGDGRYYMDMGNGSGGLIGMTDINAWSLDNASGLTIWVLCKPDSVAGTTAYNLITKGTTAQFEWGVTFNNGTAARLQCQAWTPAGLAIMSARGSGDTMTATWQAVCVAFPTPSTNAAIPLYRNNNTDITVNLNPGTANTYTNNGAQLSIGWRSDNPAGQYWQGGVAHCAVFAGQLSTTQIGRMMNAADADGWF